MNERLFHEGILEAARRAVGAGRLSGAALSATVDNPLCGDRVRLDVALEQGRIAAIGHEVRGCVLCAAAASLVAAWAPGRTPAEADEVRCALGGLLEQGTALGERGAAFEVFTPVQAHPSRHRCVLLPFEALCEALRTAAD